LLGGFSPSEMIAFMAIDNMTQAHVRVNLTRFQGENPMRNAELLCKGWCVPTITLCECHFSVVFPLAGKGYRQM